MYRYMDGHETFTELLQGYSNLIWSMCRDASHGDYELCRDMFQDVSLRLWQRYGELRREAAPHERKAWVEWQARHVLNHAGRRERPVAMSDLPEQADGDTIDEAEVRMLVDDLLAQLHPDERQLLQMKMEGYSAGEIAKKMGLSRDTVYQRMHRTMLKARKMLLMLLLLLVASSITVAVVPQWRQKVFGIGKPNVKDNEEPSLNHSMTTSPSQENEEEQKPDSTSRRHVWIPPEPIPHLVAIANTTTPTPMPTLGEPCGCPEGYHRKNQNDSLATPDDPCEPMPDELPEVSIMVVGCNIVVEGADDEIVDVFDAQGRLMTTTRCNGQCTLTIRADFNSYPNNVSPTSYWVQVGSRPRRQVFLGVSKGHPFSTYRY